MNESENHVRGAASDEPSLVPEQTDEGTYRQSRQALRQAAVRVRAFLAFAFFGGAFAWAVHLMLAQFISEWSFVGGIYRRSFLGLSISVWILLAAALALTALAAASLGVAIRLRKKASKEDVGPSPSGATADFLAAVGILSGIVFVLVILAQSLPLLFFPDGT